MFVAVACMLAAPFSLIAGGAGLAMAATTLAFVAYRVSKARLPENHDNMASRLTIAGLTLAQPVLRGWTRYKTLWGVRRGAGVGACPLPMVETAACDEADLPKVGLLRRLAATGGLFAHRMSFHRFFWNNKGLERDELLGAVIGLLRTLGVTYALDSGFAASSSTPPWDLSVKAGRLTTARLRATVETHGGDKRFVRMAGSVLPSGLSLAVLTASAAAACALAFLHPLAAVAAGAVAVSLAGAMVAGLYRAASLVATITQYVMITRPGCSLTEPKDERVAKVVKPRTAETVVAEEEPALAPAAAVAPAVETEAA